MEIFAKIISRTFDFPLWAPVLLALALFNTGLTPQQIKMLMPLLTILDIAIPILAFLFFLKKGRVSDLDVTKREERYLIFGLGSITFLISAIIVYYLGNHYFFVLNLTALLVTVTLFLITLKWKISGHLIINCSAILAINYLLNWNYLWLLLLVPLVAFARFYLKKHTILQILAGALVGFTEPYLILKYFNMI